MNEKLKREIITNLIVFVVFAFISFYVNSVFEIVLMNNFWLAGIVGIAAVMLRVLGRDKRKYRKGVEHGSARFGTKEDIKPYMDKDFRQNIILTATEGLTMNPRPVNPKYGRAKNTLIFGGSGSGKTRFYVIPNILQMHSSYVITDPKGEIFHSLGKLLKQYGGYDVRVLNLKNFGASMGYNPFDYIKTENDVRKVVDVLVGSTSKKKEGGSDGDFWVDGEKLLYTAVIGYIKFFVKDKSLHNFNTMIDMITSMEVRENDPDFKNDVDKDFEAMANVYPNHSAVLAYKSFKQGAGKTLKSFLISCGVRLAPFYPMDVRKTLIHDQMKLETIGDRKTALFIITDATSKTYHFIAAMLYSQMFSALKDRAETKYLNQGQRLPVHVRCILDEFANSTTRCNVKSVA
ncbi:MAG: type IV secretory system conjugative DNA transfer family protein [Defluviitaleaceae bacterium]|nr:type IV secretory system conjugative DNA transfer family protein [Defluviitaleaceae bacterium]